MANQSRSSRQVDHRLHETLIATLCFPHGSNQRTKTIADAPKCAEENLLLKRVCGLRTANHHHARRLDRSGLPTRSFTLCRQKHWLRIRPVLQTRLLTDGSRFMSPTEQGLLRFGQWERIPVPLRDASTPPCPSYSFVKRQ